MSYAARSDVEDRFGTGNISTNSNAWADLDNDGDADKITDRIVRALVVADNRIDDFLRGGPITVPIAGTTPITIVDLAASIAGIWLYDARSLDDSDDDTGQSFSNMRKMIEGTLKKIKTGAMRLDLARTTNVPHVVKQ